MRSTASCSWNPRLTSPASYCISTAASSPATDTEQAQGAQGAQGGQGGQGPRGAKGPGGPEGPRAQGGQRGQASPSASRTSAHGPATARGPTRVFPRREGPPQSA